MHSRRGWPVAHLCVWLLAMWCRLVDTELWLDAAKVQNYTRSCDGLCSAWMHAKLSHTSRLFTLGILARGHVLDAIDLEFPLHVVFDIATLIEEEAVGLAWRVIREFPIGSC